MSVDDHVVEPRVLGRLLEEVVGECLHLPGGDLGRVDRGVLAGDVGHLVEVEPLVQQGGRGLPRLGHGDLAEAGRQLDIAAQGVEHVRHLTRGCRTPGERAEVVPRYRAGVR